MGASHLSRRVNPEVEQAVLRALACEPRMHIVRLSEAIDADPTTVDRVCFRLQQDGHVRARGGGDYAITARGERYLRTRHLRGPEPPANH